MRTTEFFGERMNAGAGRVQGCRTVWMRCAVLLAMVLFGTLSVWASPEKGTPAPPLEFTQLLQAPAGAKANWAALRGKVVVLEFWATWCEFCLYEVPHWNDLAASVDPAKFQFITVDDEDPKIVQSFLAKRKMAGWAGIDTTGDVFRRFGIVPRPTTIIVDGKGRIVAATQPQDIRTVDLLAVAAGKSVKFKPVGNVEALIRTASPAASMKPLYEVSLTRAAPNTKLVGAMSLGPGRMDIYGWTAEALLIWAYNEIPKDRILLVDPLPRGLYNLHAIWSSKNNDPLITSFGQRAISLGLNLDVQSKTSTKNAYVLQATEVGKKLLTPTASTGGTGEWYEKGKLKLINGSMDDLAAALEYALGVPVVNETDIKGSFDEELDFPAKDGGAANAELLKVLGLKLIQEDRPIVMLVVTNREDAKKAADSTFGQTAQK